MLFPAPPVRVALSTLARLKTPPVERVSNALVRRKFALSLETMVSRSETPAPSMVAVPVQPVTVKVLLLEPPVNIASSIPARVSLPNSCQRGIGQCLISVHSLHHAIGPGAAIECIVSGAANENVTTISPGQRVIFEIRQSGCHPHCHHLM